MRTAVVAVLVGATAIIGAGPAQAHVNWDDAGEVRQHVMARARARLGDEYCWGGTRECYDCSGFTYRVFKRHGASLPHSSSMQWRTRRREGFKTVWRRSRLHKGDLVFFEGTYKGGISHVGIYAGRNRFIHAADTGIRRSRFDRYYRRHYRAAVRPRALRSPRWQR